MFGNYVYCILLAKEYNKINKRDKHDEREVRGMKQYKIVTESGKQLFNETYNEIGANSIWEMFNGIYEDDNGNEERIFIEEV